MTIYIVMIMFPFSLMGQELWGINSLNKRMTIILPNIDSLITQAQIIGREYPDSALSLLKSLHNEAQNISYKYGIVNTLIEIGRIYVFQKEEPLKALYYLKMAHPYCIYDNIDQSLFLRWHNAMGASHVVLGQYDSASVYFLRALVTALYMKPKNNEEKLLIYNNLGNLYLETKQYEKALLYFKKAANIAYKERLSRHLVPIQLGLASTYINLNRFEDAHKELGKLSQAVLTPSQKTSLNLHYGKIYYEKGMPQKAIFRFKNAATLSQSNHTSLSRLYARSLSNLGAVYMTIGDYSNAIYYIKLALKEVESKITNGVSYDLPDLYNNLAAINYSMKNYKEAYQFRTLYTIVKDSINSIEKVKVYNQLETHYRTAEKEKELNIKQLQLVSVENTLNKRNLWIRGIVSVAIILLLAGAFLFQRQRLKLQKARTREQGQKIRQLSAIIEAEEKERSRIGHQLHDAVMVEFSLLKMKMAALPERYPEVNDIGEYKELTAHLNSATIKLRQTAHNLMPDALLEEGLVSAIHYFCNGIQKISTLSINFQHYGDLPRLQSDIEVNLYRIVQELIQNVIKHAAATRILVQLSYRKGQLSIIVEDNGIGMKNIRQQPEGMGLKSIGARLQAIGGLIEFYGVDPHGTSVNMDIPI